MQFTDDSAMTYSLAESLVKAKDLDVIDLAKRFVKSYYMEPNRGYGPAVVTVFEKLRGNRFADVVGPAKEQFNGQGSLGNGGAMRVAPIGLFCYQNYDKLLETVRKATQITHTHKVGMDGAILQVMELQRVLIIGIFQGECVSYWEFLRDYSQAVAVHQSLLLNPKEKLNVMSFIDDLIDKMDKIEEDEEGYGLEVYLNCCSELISLWQFILFCSLGISEPQPYKIQLGTIKSLISEAGEGPHAEKVVQKLGNSVTALYSVPTAIFCFLRAQKPITGIETENPFRRAIQYAVSSVYCGEIIYWTYEEIEDSRYRCLNVNLFFRLV